MPNDASSNLQRLAALEFLLRPFTFTADASAYSRRKAVAMRRQQGYGAYEFLTLAEKARADLWLEYSKSFDDVKRPACKHVLVATTPIGAATNTDWTCQECGKLLSKSPAPDQVTP